jgi:hypothetical protein
MLPALFGLLALQLSVSAASSHTPAPPPLRLRGGSAPALSMPPLLRLRGGRGKAAAPAKSESFTTKFVAKVVAAAVAPTLVSLARSYAKYGTVGPAMPKPWQYALAVAWAANMIAVGVPGRYDGRSAMAAEKPTAATANLFTPAGWAFAIWGPIFIGEWLMMSYLTFVDTGPSFRLGMVMAPGWCAGIASQVLWCATFRPSVCGPSLLWLPAALLAITGVGLGVSHRAIRTWIDGNWGGPLCNAIVRWPVALHFGWITAASLVNLNNWLARRKSTLQLKKAVAFGSVAAAVTAACYVTASTRDPIFALVIAWALAAVAADGSRSARGLVDAALLDQLRAAARLGCGLAALLVCTQL